jgi:hypothetical protein
LAARCDALRSGAVALWTYLGHPVKGWVSRMLNDFLSGAIMMCYLVAGLFFLRFWFATRDRLFMFFAMAFWVLGVNQIFSIFVAEGTYNRSYIYLIRLLAFVLILVGIGMKNRSQHRAEASK